MSESRAQQARVAVRITGRVQGVGFRFSALDEARSLGLTGWVRNANDGGVELVAEGDADCLRRLVTWCHRGPRGALVTDVEQEWLTYSGEFDGFQIRS